ncbi:MAG: hypothetical protein AB1730_24625 [Myxococcota bacterium]|jgi:hypothetical protein
MKRTALSLLALLALPAFAQETAPAPAPAPGAPAPAPTDGSATTATPKGSGTKKQKPAQPEEKKGDEAKDEKK